MMIFKNSMMFLMMLTAIFSSEVYASQPSLPAVGHLAYGAFTLGAAALAVNSLADSKWKSIVLDFNGVKARIDRPSKGVGRLKESNTLEVTVLRQIHLPSLMEAAAFATASAALGAAWFYAAHKKK